MPFRAVLPMLLLTLPTPAFAAPDAATGQTLFRSRTCTVCHSLAPGKNMNGPSLAGVFGRAIGKAPGYKYSPDLTAAKGNWDARKLDAWLSDPRSVFPSAKMATKVVSSDDRAAIIAYLKSNPAK